MNQFFAAAATLLVALTLLGLGKKPKNLLLKRVSAYKNLDVPSLVLPHNESQEEKVEGNLAHSSFRLPTSSKERFLLQQKLKRLISLDPDKRFLAVQIASEWGHQSVIPILKRGLKDMDSRIVKRAAEGIEQFKGSQKIISKKKLVHHPLNVSLMR